MLPRALRYDSTGSKLYIPDRAEISPKELDERDECNRDTSGESVSISILIDALLDKELCESFRISIQPGRPDASRKPMLVFVSYRIMLDTRGYVAQSVINPVHAALYRIYRQDT